MTAAAIGWSDHLHPLAVRLTRQHLRSRWLLIALFALPPLCCAAALFGHLRPDAAGSGRGWSWLFDAYIAAWTLIVLVVDPVLLGAEIARERRPDTWDLLRLSGMGPLRMTVGAVTAGAVRGALATTLMLPFLGMSWLLRGVDTAQLLAASVLVPAWMLAAYALAARAACPPARSAWRVGAVALVLLLAWAGFGLSVDLVRHHWIGSVLGDLHGPAELASTLLWAVAGIVAAALLTIDAAERSSGPWQELGPATRGVAAIGWLALWSCALLLIGTPLHDAGGALSSLWLTTTALLMWAAVQATSEHAHAMRKRWRRQTRSDARTSLARPPRARWLGLLSPGRAGGCRFLLALLAAQALALVILCVATEAPLAIVAVPVLLAPMGGVLGSCLIAAVIARRADPSAFRPHVQRRIACGIVAGLLVCMALSAFTQAWPLLILPGLIAFLGGLAGAVAVLVWALETMYPVTPRAGRAED